MKKNVQDPEMVEESFKLLYMYFSHLPGHVTHATPIPVQPSSLRVVRTENKEAPDASLFSAYLQYMYIKFVPLGFLKTRQLSGNLL
jgi:hypothetical protein